MNDDGRRQSRLSRARGPLLAKRTTGYPHDGRADNTAYPHEGGADNAAVPQLGINSVAGRPVALFPRPVVPFMFSVTPCLFVNLSALYRLVLSIRIDQFHADLCLLPWGIYACVSNHHRDETSSRQCVPVTVT